MKKYSYLISSENNNNQALCLTKKQAEEYKKTFEKTDRELQKVYHWAILPTYKIEKIKRIINLESSKMLHIIELNQKLNNELYEDYMQMLGEQQEEVAKATPDESEIIEYAEENNYLDDLFIKIHEDGTSDHVVYDLDGRCYM